MTNELLDDLKRADPVAVDDLVVSPDLRARVLRPRRSRWLLVPLAGAALAVGVVAVVALIPGRAPTPDLAQRAYAAMAPQGIVHWRTDLAGYFDNQVKTRQRYEAWQYGDQLHFVSADTLRHRVHVVMDTRFAGDRYTIWSPSSDEYQRGTAKGRQTTDPIGGDPARAFRAAYRQKRLRNLGGGRFELVYKHVTRGSLIYTVDQKTGLPKQLVMTNPARPGSKSVATFSVYEHLAPTPANRTKLQLFPHPGAGPGTADPGELFAVLRAGPPLDATDAKKLDTILRTRHVGAGDVRALNATTWLLPNGKRHICVINEAQAEGSPLPKWMGPGFGVTCVSVKTMARHGVGLGTSTRTTVIVPDAIRQIEIRYRFHGRWTKLAVKHNIARLPGAGYEWRFVR